jgi:hypothetical protein
MATKPQHIISLEVHDTLRLKAFLIQPNGEPVVIGGDNDQGKSTALQVIRMLVLGAKEIPAKPVRRGAKLSRAVLETDDYKIMRVTKTDRGCQSFNVVSKKTGVDEPRPQEFLKSWLGKTAFDPLDFARGDKHKRLATMKRIAGVDTEEIDGKISGLEGRRTEIGRDVKRLQGAVDSIEVPENVPAAVDVKQLQTELEYARNINGENESKTREINSLREQRERVQAVIAEQQRKLAEVNERGRMLKVWLDQTKGIDEQPIIDRLSRAAEVASLRARSDEHHRAQVQLDEAVYDSEQTAEQLEASREQRRKMIAGVTFPVEGLGFGVDDVEYEGLPFDQAGSGAQLRISVAVALVEAQKSQLRVMLIDDAEKLDKHNRAMVFEMAAAAGVQPIMACCSLGDECTVIVEDGEVKA